MAQNGPLWNKILVILISTLSEHVRGRESDHSYSEFMVEPKAIYVHKVVRAADIKIYIKVAGLFSIILS